MDFKTLYLNKLLAGIEGAAIHVESTGMVIVCGGLNTLFEKIEQKIFIIDCKSETKIDLANMMEARFHHRVTICNNKIYVLGGYNDIGMTERS
jgi:hypothetical protein